MHVDRDEVLSLWCDVESSKHHLTAHQAVLAATERICNLLNTLNAELNPIRHLLAFVAARHIVHVTRIRVKAA